MEISFQKVSIHVHPAFSPPYLFPIGDVAVTYTATDPSSNQASCTFHIKVIGKSSDYLGKFVKIIQNPQKLWLFFIFSNFLFFHWFFLLSLKQLPLWNLCTLKLSLYLWFLSIGTYWKFPSGCHIFWLNCHFLKSLNFGFCLLSS